MFFFSLGWYQPQPLSSSPRPHTSGESRTATACDRCHLLLDDAPFSLFFFPALACLHPSACTRTFCHGEARTAKVLVAPGGHLDHILLWRQGSRIVPTNQTVPSMSTPTTKPAPEASAAEQQERSFPPVRKEKGSKKPKAIPQTVESCKPAEKQNEPKPAPPLRRDVQKINHSFTIKHSFSIHSALNIHSPPPVQSFCTCHLSASMCKIDSTGRKLQNSSQNSRGRVAKIKAGGHLQWEWTSSDWVVECRVWRVVFISPPPPLEWLKG